MDTIELNNEVIRSWKSAVYLCGSFAWDDAGMPSGGLQV